MKKITLLLALFMSTFIYAQCGTPETAPYLEDFETMTPSTAAFSAENCWTGTNTGYFWELTLPTDTSSAGTGPAPAVNTGNYFFTEASSTSTGDMTELISPFIDVTPLTVPAVSFSYHMYGSKMGTLHVDVYDGTTWNMDVGAIVGEQQTADTDQWLQSIIDISGLTITGPIQIRFRGESGGNWESDMSIDNVAVNEVPSCVAPNTLTVANVTTTTANLGWASTESAWDIEYGVTPFTPTGTPTITNTANNPENVTGLTADTEYQFMVRANCGGSGNSTWTGPFTFRTLCVALTAPIMEDFEAMTTGTAAFGAENCWTGTGGSYFWELAPGADLGSANTGPDPSVNTGDITELLSPSIDVSGLTTPSISFSYHMFGNAIGTLHVDVYDGAAWNMDVVSFVGQQQTADRDAWLQSVTDISALTITGPIQVRFRGEKGAGGFTGDISIDNFGVSELTVLGLAEVNQIEGFKLYPNPVVNILKVSAQNNINSLHVVNILGQVVKAATPNVQAYELDMSSLATGFYFVKAHVNNVEVTYRIVKQ